MVKVEGESAFPELISGRYYFASILKKPKIGRYVVFKNPMNGEQIFVKKIIREEHDGFYVAGTVSWATSSQTLGLISTPFILGVLL